MQDQNIADRYMSNRLLGIWKQWSNGTLDTLEQVLGNKCVLCLSKMPPFKSH